MAKYRTIGMRIDIESRSRTDIKAGAYRYAEDPEFKVLIIAYSMIHRYPGGAIKLSRPKVLDQSNEAACARFRDLLADERFQKHAFNANFERITLSKWSGMANGTYLDPKNWQCTAIRANVNGVFGTLDEVGKALRSPATKDAEGKRLIRLFSIPDRKTGQFHDPCIDGALVCWCGSASHPEDFAKFEDYCCQDVVTEAMVAKLLNNVPQMVQDEYEADQRINDRGIKHFKKMSVQAVAQVEIEKDRLMGELGFITGLDNPNSIQQMKGWLETQGYPMTSLDKVHREAALADPDVPDDVADVLTLKGSASLSSVTKHKAALNTRCADGRLRGTLQFYGAHTGREAGRGIQPQNLPRYEAPRADMIRLLQGTAGADAPTIAKGSVRASLVPARGHLFVVLDYSAIEARVLGNLCGEDWVNAEFAGQGKIYEATAAIMLNAVKDDIVAGVKACGKCGHCVACSLRGRGKVSELALGFGGGAGALVTMGAEAEGVDIGNYGQLKALWVADGSPGKFWEWNRDLHDYPELIRLRDLYRAARPATAGFWKLNARAWDAASLGKSVRYGANKNIVMMRDGQHNRMVLPSGRSIWYRFARSHPHPDYPDKIDRRSFIGKSGGIGHIRTDTHGGKLTENVTQAVARDVLFDLIMRIEAQRNKPGRIVLHVHDEVVLEVPEADADQRFADIKGLMEVAPEWATGLAVQGAGDIMERYGK